MVNKFWTGSVSITDDFGNVITDTFIDGKSKTGPWGFFTPEAYKEQGMYPDKFGNGIAQKYDKQKDGRWLKTKG